MSLPHPASPEAPKYWRHEVTGRLEGPIKRYLENAPLSGDDAMLIRLYLQQWINSLVWEMNPHTNDGARRKLAEMRKNAREIKTRKDIDGWIHAANDIGIDPL